MRPIAVSDAPAAVAAETVIRPGSASAAPTVVVPTSVRWGPKAAATGASVPSPFCRGTARPSGASTGAAADAAAARS